MLKLDLHRQRHEEAERLTIRFIEQYWDIDEEARIITGNSDKMKKIVMDILDKYDLSYYIGDRFGMNTGQITVEL